MKSCIRLLIELAGRIFVIATGIHYVVSIGIEINLITRIVLVLWAILPAVDFVYHFYKEIKEERKSTREVQPGIDSHEDKN